MSKRWQVALVAGLSAGVICVTVTLVGAQVATKGKAPSTAQTGKSMSVEEARKVAAQTQTYVRPPRTIDDIAKILDQHKPDPAKIKKLQEIADKKTPPNLNGMALADFLYERGQAARDLGRTQQRVTDLREAYKIAKPLASRRSQIWVADFPTQSNPSGSPAYQEFINAKRAAKAANQTGPAPNRRDGPGVPVSGLNSGKTNYDFMPKTAEQGSAAYNARIPKEQQRAVFIVSAYIAAEADAGNYQTATAVWDEVRPGAITSMTPPSIAVDVRMVGIRLNAGDVDGAKRMVARIQQVYAMYRQHAYTWPVHSTLASSVEAGLAQVALATGQPGEAETRLRNAMRFKEASIKDLLSSGSPPPPGSGESNIASLRLQLATALFRQNKLIEAELETRRGLVDFLRLQGVDGPKTANTVLILADILQAQGRYKDAFRLAEIALDTYVRGGVETAVHAEAYQRMAVAEASQGRWANAMAIYDKLRTAVANDNIARRRFLDTNLDLAVALLRGGQAERAIPILEGAVKSRTTSGAGEYAVAEVTGFLGAAFAAVGRQSDAVRTMRSVVPVLLNSANTAAKEEGQIDDTQRRQAIVDAYFELLTRVRGSDVEKALGFDATDEAFRMADVARAKAVHSAIAATSARAASGDAALNELIRQTQDSDQQLAAMSEMLKSMLNAPVDQQDQKAVQTLRGDIAKLQEARKTLRSEIERRFPQYAQLVNPKPVSIAEVQAKLADGDALIATYFTGGRGYVWAVPKQGAGAFAAMTASESEIADLVDRLHKTVNSEASSINEILPFDVALAHKLYAAVMEPVAAGWHGARNVIVIAHGTLGRLPFQLLVTRPTAQPEEQPGTLRFAGYRNVPFLIREATVTHVPSVAAFASLRSTPAGAKNRKPFIGFGDPWFSREQAEIAREQEQEKKIQLAAVETVVAMRAVPKTGGLPSAELAQLPRLPDTAAELREIALALGADPDKDILLGAKASEKAVRSMKLDDRRVVMFATHGLVPGELDGLNQPALALSSPEIEGVEGDGFLTVERILSLKLDADWVVLSACNTAAGEGAGAEAVSGLGRAFFYAGARALLATHWPVETMSARLLTTDLFRRYASAQDLSRAAALREAMTRMIETGQRDGNDGRALFAYAHPLFWAPFTIIGDGGGS